jgi:hypothetical protein
MVMSLPMGPAAEPEFTDSKCLKGPCVHLWQIETSFAHGNTEGTFEKGKEPRKTTRACTGGAAEEMELDGTTVFKCDRWKPYTQAELLEKARRELDYAEREKKESVTK